MRSQLEAQQQEVLTLQQSLTTAKQEKDTLEHELGDLVRLMTYVALGYKLLIFFMLYATLNTQYIVIVIQSLELPCSPPPGGINVMADRV